MGGHVRADGSWQEEHGVIWIPDGVKEKKSVLVFIEMKEEVGNRGPAATVQYLVLYCGWKG